MCVYGGSRPGSFRASSSAAQACGRQQGGQQPPGQQAQPQRPAQSPGATLISHPASREPHLTMHTSDSPTELKTCEGRKHSFENCFPEEKTHFWAVHVCHVLSQLRTAGPPGAAQLRRSSRRSCCDVRVSDRSRALVRGQRLRTMHPTVLA